MKIKLILVILFFPMFASAEGLFLSPGIFKSEEVLQSSKPYTAEFVISNTGEMTKVKASVSCINDSPGMCPDSSWFNVSPKEFTLGQNQSQVVKVKINLPKKAMNGEYRTLLNISSAIKMEEESGASSIATNLGGWIIFKKEGSVGFFWSVIYLFQDRVGAPMTASLSSVGLDAKTAAIFFGVIVLLIIATTFFKKPSMSLEDYSNLENDFQMAYFKTHRNPKLEKQVIKELEKIIKQRKRKLVVAELELLPEKIREKVLKNKKLIAL